MDQIMQTTIALAGNHRTTAEQSKAAALTVTRIGVSKDCTNAEIARVLAHLGLHPDSDTGSQSGATNPYGVRRTSR